MTKRADIGTKRLIGLDPVVINILRPRKGQRLVRRFSSSFRGFIARQDFRVINLWEVDANRVVQEPLLPLLPFTPILKGGNSETIVQQAAFRLRADANLAQMENLLAFFASFVMNTELVQRIMRWDMAVLRESPWYTEIRQEGWQIGLEKGLEQGLKLGERRNMRESILRVLQHRFGPVPADFEQQLQELDLPELRGLLDAALDVDSLAEFGARLLAHA
jgi:predicted transposase YdaD